MVKTRLVRSFGKILLSYQAESLKKTKTTYFLDLGAIVNLLFLCCVVSEGQQKAKAESCLLARTADGCAG